MGAAAIHIRDFVADSDAGDLRKCVIELQDQERRLDPRLPGGSRIANDYIPEMLQRCRQSGGKVLLAQVGDDIAGYATILTKVRCDEIAAGDTEFGLVTDLFVAEQFRQQGIGRKLLVAAERYARECGVKWLRVGSLAGNQAVDRLYESLGYAALFVEREKDLSRP